MSLWTKRHIIPFSNRSDTYVRIKSIVFEGKIWMIFDVTNTQSDEFEHLLTKLLVFDTDSEVFTEIDCIYPAACPRELHTLVANEENLYMWRVTYNYQVFDYHLFKLDRVTLEWEKIMKVRRDSEWISVAIINQVMYIFERGDDIGGDFLITIDLNERKLVDIVKNGMAWYSFLTIHNRKLYQVENRNDTIKVLEWKSGMAVEIGQEHHDFDDNERVEVVQCADPDECFAFSQCYTNDPFEVRMFDFESLKWQFNVIQPGRRKTVGEHLCVLKVNELYYSLVQIENSQSEQFELYVLDPHPSLTSICLDDLKNRYSEETDEQKVDEVKQKLSIPLRSKLTDLLEWESEAKQ